MPDSKTLIGASFQYQHKATEIPCQQFCLVSLGFELLKDDF